MVNNMKVIEYVRIFNYLKDVEELDLVNILRTIYKLRKLPKELLLAVDSVISGKEPTITINGVSYEELVEKDGMRPIRAILMLDWIRREPDAAFAYMAECTRRAPIMPLNSEELDEVKLAIERLKKQVKEQPKPVNGFEDIKTDIEIPEQNEINPSDIVEHSITDNELESSNINVPSSECKKVEEK